MISRAPYRSPGKTGRLTPLRAKPKAVRTKAPLAKKK